MRSELDRNVLPRPVMSERVIAIGYKLERVVAIGCKLERVMSELERVIAIGCKLPCQSTPTHNM
jgi:hypothetical protein